MDDNNRNINGSEPEKKDSGFNFVQEKVKSKRRKRVKRILLIFGLTIVCAVLFGFVARFVFVKSEGLFNSVMGVTVTPTPAETQRQQVALPTATPTPEVTAVPTEQPTATPTPTEEATPSVSAGDSGEDAEVGGEGEAPEEEPESALIQYAQMVSGMKDVVTKVSGALLPVTAITTDVNWLDEIVTSEYRFSSLVMGDNGVELLLLATCYDRLKDADELLVELSPGVIVDAKVFGYDEDYNLAILAVLNKNLPDSMLEGLQTVELGSSASVAAGLPVIALGSPNGVNGSLAYGFVTLTGDTAYVTDGKVDLFYTDAGNIANGEGIIVNLEGQLVGIITRSLKSKKMVDSCTVAGVSSVEKVILNLLNRVDRPYLGVLAEDIPAEDLKRLDLENGIYVCDVVSGSPADAAGIKKGDVITEIKLAGIEEPAHIRSVSGYMAAVAQTTVGDEVAIGIYRTSSAENTAFEVTAVIGKK